MDLQPNKIDGIVKPITNTRISASEWNQLVGSCMAFITAAGFTPDADDNQQFLNAFIQIAQDIGAVGANVDLSNLSATGENHFVQLQSGVAQADVDYVVESYQNGTSWYRVYKSGWCEQGGVVSVAQVPAGADVALLKQYGTTDYTLSISLNTLASSWSAEANPRAIQGLTEFHIQSGGGTSPSNMSWVAQGYIVS